MFKRPDTKYIANHEGAKYLEPGGYVIRIDSCHDDESRQSLEIAYEIVEGECKGDSARRIAKGWNPNRFWVGYGERMQWQAGNFIKAVEDTNSCHLDDRYICRDLVNRQLGIVLQYRTCNGSRTLRPAYFCSADKIRSGDYTLPKEKTDGSQVFTEIKNNSTVEGGDDGELPF